MILSRWDLAPSGGGDSPPASRCPRERLGPSRGLLLSYLAATSGSPDSVNNLSRRPFFPRRESRSTATGRQVSFSDQEVTRGQAIRAGLVSSEDSMMR